MTEAAQPAPTPPRLTLAHQALANLMGVWALEVLAEIRAPLQDQIRAILPDARADVPPGFVAVVRAAEAIADLASREVPLGHVDWFKARAEASRAMMRFFNARATAAWAAHEARLSPIEETDDVKS